MAKSSKFITVKDPATGAVTTIRKDSKYAQQYTSSASQAAMQYAAGKKPKGVHRIAAQTYGANQATKMAERGASSDAQLLRELKRIAKSKKMTPFK